MSVLSTPTDRPNSMKVGDSYSCSQLLHTVRKVCLQFMKFLQHLKASLCLPSLKSPESITRLLQYNIPGEFY